MQTNSATSKTTDRFTGKYVVWALAAGLPVLVAHELDRLFNLYLMLVPIVLLPLLVCGIAVICSISTNLNRHRPRQAASAFAAPIIATTFYALSAPVLSLDRINFALSRRTYEAEIARITREDGAPLFKTWKWGETGGAGVANIFETLIFDESDEIALSPLQHSAKWKNRVAEKCPGRTCWIVFWPPLDGYSNTVIALGRHFYLVREIY